MKLGFTTYQLPQNLNFEESIRLAKKTGCAGIDFRTGNVYKHGVEVSLSPEERRQMRRMLEDNYLELASINSEYSFDNPDENERRKSIEGAKQCCLLASDFGSRLVRLFGNIIRTDDAHETVKYVSDAIREVCDGRKYLSPEARGLLQSDPPLPPLSNRQQEVLQALGHGYTNRDIALQLGISSRSVEVHVNTLLAKIGAANRTEAVAIALRKHLLKI